MSVVNVNSVDDLRVGEGTLKRFWCQMGERFREQKEREMEEFEEENGGIEGICPKGVMGKYFPVSSAVAKEKFDANGFTEPFDLERFRAGEIAYKAISGGDGYLYEIYGVFSYKWTRLSTGNTGLNLLDIIGNAKMRHTAGKVNDGWVPVVGGKCPEMEKDTNYDIRSRDGMVYRRLCSEALKWDGNGWNNNGGDIVAVRRSFSAQPAENETRHEQVITEKEVDWLKEILLKPVSVTPERNFAKEMREVVEGWGMLLEGGREGEVVEVKREVFAALRRDV